MYVCSPGLECIWLRFTWRDAAEATFIQARQLVEDRFSPAILAILCLTTSSLLLEHVYHLDVLWLSCAIIAALALLLNISQRLLRQFSAIFYTPFSALNLVLGLALCAILTFSFISGYANTPTALGIVPPQQATSAINFSVESFTTTVKTTDTEFNVKLLDQSQSLRPECIQREHHQQYYRYAANECARIAHVHDAGYGYGNEYGHLTS